MKKIITAATLVVGLSVSVFAGRADIYIEECNGGMAEMCHMAAQFLADEKKPDEAKKYYMKAMNIMKKECSAGEADPCYGMGEFYRQGLGVKKSKSKAKKAYEESAKLFQKKCDKGDEDSCMMVKQLDMKIEML